MCQCACALRVVVLHHDKHINIRLGVEIAAHFGAVENDTPHLIAKLLAQARQILGKRLLLAPSQILETITLHHFPSNAARAITIR